MELVTEEHKGKKPVIFDEDEIDDVINNRFNLKITNMKFCIRRICELMGYDDASKYFAAKLFNYKSVRVGLFGNIAKFYCVEMKYRNLRFLTQNLRWGNSDARDAIGRGLIHPAAWKDILFLRPATIKNIQDSFDKLGYTRKTAGEIYDPFSFLEFKTFYFVRDIDKYQRDNIHDALVGIFSAIVYHEKISIFLDKKIDKNERFKIINELATFIYYHKDKFNINDFENSFSVNIDTVKSVTDIIFHSLQAVMKRMKLNGEWFYAGA